MATANNQYDIEQLAKVDSNGFQAALFPQIKDAYVKKMQEIYGYDIDVSSASADGQFVMAESLVLNNIYRTLESLSDNLSPASATGKYLDILSSLSGAFRQGATYSTATVYIANSSSTPLSPSYLLLNDKNGNRWQWINPISADNKPSVTFPAKSADNYSATAIEVTCTELGPITASATGTITVKEGGKDVTRLADMSQQSDRNIVFNLPAKDRGGDIFETINASSLLVYQQSDAITGFAEETDASLRARRLRSFGQSGRTVLDSMAANLLAVPGVIDAWVYSNNTNSDIPVTMVDDAKVPAHSVYAIIATQPDINVPSVNIGTAIYNTITPGIATTAAGNLIKGGNINSEAFNITDHLMNTIYWKKALLTDPTLTIEFTLKNDLAGKMLSDSQKTAITNTITEFFNNINIGEDVSMPLLTQLIESVDFRTAKYGLPTYEVKSIFVKGLGDTTDQKNNILKNPLTRFYYYRTPKWNNNILTIGSGIAWPNMPVVATNLQNTETMASNDEKNKLIGLAMVTNKVEESHKYQIVFNYSENDPAIQEFINRYANYNLAFNYNITLDNGTTWNKIIAPADGMKPGYYLDFQATTDASFAIMIVVVNDTAPTEIQKSIAEFIKNNCAFSIVQLD